jgi:very-short-patch-repair endonuclease
MPKQIFNRKPLKQFRKNLRNNLTPAEAILWTYMKKKQLDGRKFRRQHSIGNYIVDFYCPAEKLAVELDGAAHYTTEGEEHDLARDEYLMNLGIKVLRYENRDVFNNIEAVLDDIKKNFKDEKH